jgi:ATP-binding protein involved in chromosome partitioning
VDTDSILNALRQVKYPGFSRDIVSFGLVKKTEVRGEAAVVALAVAASAPEVPERIRAEVEAALLAAGFARAEVSVAVSAPPPPPNAPAAAVAAPKPEPVAGVRRVIAIASGKGGVGKSTFSVNIACALAQLRGPDGEPLRVGLLDCDIHGPSIPLMMGLSGQPEIAGEMFTPPQNHGVKVMSLGFFIDEDSPVIWRGPMIMKIIRQFATQVAWGGLDVLVVDLPPGTGDAPLSLAQTVALDGAVIVTTPQAAAASVARRGAAMFPRMEIPLLGVAENMSWLAMPDGGRQEIFGGGGGKAAAEALGTEFLGQVPLDPNIREGGDAGAPVVVTQPASESGAAFITIASRILEKILASA